MLRSRMVADVCVQMSRGQLVLTGALRAWVEDTRFVPAEGTRSEFFMSEVLGAEGRHYIRKVWVRDGNRRDRGR
jgi:hypothetical protein